MHEPAIFSSHRVYTKQVWAGEWTLRSYLRAPTFTFACGPDFSTATLEYKYGKIQRNDDHEYDIYFPNDFSDFYVKIVVEDGPTWYGIIVDQNNQRSGESLKYNNPILTGTQQFFCRGLEYLLHRKTIDTSAVVNNAAEEFEDIINRAIGFNLGGGLPSAADKIANRTLGPNGARGTHIFIEDLEEASEWSASEILEYMIAYHAPVDIAGNDNLGWFADRTAYRDILEAHTPALHVHGKTFFQVLNELIDRRRLMGWYVKVDPNDERPEIKVFTFNTTFVQLADNIHGIPANDNQVAAWDFYQNNRVQQFSTQTDGTARYDRVIARGEPQGSCFTIGIQESTSLETDWATAQKTEYRAAATTDADYATMGPLERFDANQQVRAREKLRKVYRYFRVPPTFDGTIGGNIIWPRNKDTSNSRKFWWPGLRFQDRLPLKLEHDYEDAEDITNAMKALSKWEYQRPFAYYQGASGRAYLLDRMSRGDVSTEIETSGRYWSASLRMQDDAFGIIIDVHGAPQHVIADNDFTPIDADDTADWGAVIDYSYIRATVFAEGDGHVEESWPQNVPNNDYIKELIIWVPNARLDYLVPGTVVDIDDEGNPITTNGGFVRDDTDYLKNVASSAYQWHSQERVAINVTIRETAETRVRGELILSIGSGVNEETINTVVTNCTYDMRAGTANYITQFAELNF